MTAYVLCSLALVLEVEEMMRRALKPLFDGSVAGLECGHDFFGAEHIVFGTDFPFDLANGDKLINQAIDAVNQMRISDADKKLIFEDNAKRILHLDI